MSSTQQDLIARALSNHELDKFIVGTPPYFFDAKSDNQDPQNVSQAFDLLLLPHWLNGKDANFPHTFVSALLTALNHCQDQNRAIYAVSDWIWYYCFCLKKKRDEPAGRYADLFEVDLQPVATQLKSLLEANKAHLENDQRWAGASWNSANGLWEPLIRTARAVRDDYAGPDFFPSNA